MIAAAREFWTRYDWSRAGEEWSSWWGGTENLYRVDLRPRLRRFLPAGSVLEIACGYGRITRYLIQECQQLIGVDIVAACVDACRLRFGADNVRFHLCDGTTLPMVADASIDLAVSWDSLVHSPPEIIEAYVVELARVLSPTGAAVLHHSNLGALPLHGISDRHGRDWRMTARLMRAFCAKAGVACATELFSWGGAADLDCIATIRRTTDD